MYIERDHFGLWLSGLCAEKQKHQLYETLNTGWLRLVGSLKLYVSSVKYSLFYRALLQKRPVILRSLLIVATPYERWGAGVETHFQEI